MNFIHFCIFANDVMLHLPILIEKTHGRTSF
nr:MAG TPA: hypothetical protein [Caudoviricetes sp.]